jgi:hypothetical protein
MKRSLLFVLVTIFFTIANHMVAQNIPAHPKSIKNGNFLGISQPLRDIPAMSQEGYNRMVEKAKKRAKT